MKLSQIEYFLAVASHLNFTAAAKSLYISQPALSKQIALLEEEIGTKLLIRNSRSVTLTAAGKQFEHDMISILRQIDRAKHTAAEIGKNDTPIFRVGCFDGMITSDFLPDLYDHVQRTVPDMQMHLVRGSFDENRQLLEHGELDLLISLNLDWIEQEGYQTRVLARRKGGLIYSIHSPLAETEHLSLSDFEKQPFLIHAKEIAPNLHQNTLENLKRLGITPPTILEMENMSTLTACLEMGRGYTLLSAQAAKGNPLLRVFEPNVDIRDVEVLAIWKKEHPLAKII